MNKERNHRPGGATGGQAALAGGVAPVAEAQSWPRLGSARLGSARLGSARLGSARLGSARLGSARLGSARLGSARLGSARLGSARLGSARLGSARLGSARLGSARNRRLNTRAGCQVFCRVVHPCSPSASLRPGESRGQGDGSDRAHRRRLPIAAVPHDTAVSGVVEVSNNTDRRVSVRNVERTQSKLGLVTTQLTRASPDRKTERICPMEKYDLAKCAALSSFDCSRISDGFVSLGDCRRRSWARSWAMPLSASATMWVSCLIYPNRSKINTPCASPRRIRTAVVDSWAF